jgi:hypothetical protein
MGGGMRASLGSLYCRRNLRVRSGEKPGDLFGQPLIGGQARELALPQIEVAPREFVESIVLGRSHVPTIDHRCACRVRIRKACLVALRYRR